MEEKSILDSVYKECVCCGQKRTLRNYRMIGKSEINDGMTLIADMFSNVCKCCEAHPELQLKSNRLDLLRSKREHFRQNAIKRIEKEKQKELELEG